MHLGVARRGDGADRHDARLRGFLGNKLVHGFRVAVHIDEGEHFFLHGCRSRIRASPASCLG